MNSRGKERAMTSTHIHRIARSVSAVGLIALLGCGGDAEESAPAATEGAAAPTGGGISPRAMADALHAVMEADRTVYTRNVVNRLQNQEEVIRASEHWEDDKALPLPAQMFRMGAEIVGEREDAGFTYSLMSPWPINSQNSPRTDVERDGMNSVVETSAPFYGEETLGDVTYFTAIYPDIAVADACISCHNGHADSPRDDFELGNVMGGVVIRIPLGS